MSSYLEREVERLIYIEKRLEVQESERRPTEGEEKNRMRNVSEDVIFIFISYHDTIMMHYMTKSMWTTEHLQPNPQPLAQIYSLCLLL